MVLSIIIPTLKSSPKLNRLLNSLALQEMASKIQVICINNIKSQARYELINQYQDFFYDFKYINSSKIGANVARNTGIRFASGELFYFIDDDCEIPQKATFLTEIIEVFSHYPHIDVLGGLYLPPKAKINLFSEAYFKIAHSWQMKGNLIGGNTVYRSSLFKNGLRFDSSLTFGGTEESLNDIIIKKNYQIRLVGNFSIIHNIDLSLIIFLRKAYKQGQGHSRLKKKMTKNEKVRPRTSFPGYVYSFFFRLGYYSTLDLKPKVSSLGFEFFSIFKVIHILWGRIKGPVQNMLYFVRNNAVKPFIKLYFVAKYHHETYLIPLIKKLLKKANTDL